MTDVINSFYELRISCVKLAVLERVMNKISKSETESMYNHMLLVFFVLVAVKCDISKKLSIDKLVLLVITKVI